MAKFAATDVCVILNGQNISDWVFSVDMPDSKGQIDVSGFNSTGAMEFVPGQRDQQIALGILQDFGATQIHQLLKPLYEGNTEFSIEVRPTSAARSATNPWYGGSANIYDYDGMNVQLNSRAEIHATIRPSSNHTWTWATV